MERGTTLSADQAIERMHRGREATVASGLLRPMVDAEIQRVTARLCNEYAAGTASHDLLVGGIAEITALRRLMADLERIHNKGVAAAEQAHAQNRSSSP